MRAQRLYVAISFHGFGHVAQTAPVLHAAARRHRSLKLTIRCAAPRELIERLVQLPFGHERAPTDAGMQMHGSLDVLAEASHAACSVMHERWSSRVQAESRALARQRPDLVVSNVSYLQPAAAAAAGIPSMALCSLNWADVYWHYCAEYTGARVIHEQMVDGYATLKRFLTPAPSMSMRAVDNPRTVGPISRLGEPRRRLLRERLRVSDRARVVVVCLGGITTHLPLDQWPPVPGIIWVVSPHADTARQDVVAVERLGMPFIDVLRSADALITKPGYNSFVEAACNGTPVLYVRRPDWPEEGALVRWLNEHARCREITRDQLYEGDLSAPLAELWSQPAPQPVAPHGAEEAAEQILQLLS